MSPSPESPAMSKPRLTALASLLCFGPWLLAAGCGDDPAPTGADTAAVAPDAADSGASETGGGDSAGAPDTATTADSGPDVAAADAGPDVALEGCQPGNVPCEDQVILDLALVKNKVATGAIVNTADGADWVSTVDATAGGFQVASTNPWLYAKFTDQGLEAVAVDDHDALLDETWDIAFKRYGVRLNSGPSGPGCVLGGAAEGYAYADITGLVPVRLEEESFYTAACGLIDDGSGLGGPGYVLSAWWDYPVGCVVTTGTPALVLGNGHLVKLVVEAYYETGQDTCNTTGAPGTGSAMLRVRWQILP